MIRANMLKRSQILLTFLSEFTKRKGHAVHVDGYRLDKFIKGEISSISKDNLRKVFRYYFYDDNMYYLQVCMKYQSECNDEAISTAFEILPQSFVDEQINICKFLCQVTGMHDFSITCASDIKHCIVVDYDVV